MSELKYIKKEKSAVKIVNIQAWMLTLGLNTLEMYIYAHIWNITQYNNVGWNMGLNDFMSYLNLDKADIKYNDFVDALNSLQDKELIVITENGNNGTFNFRAIN